METFWNRVKKTDTCWIFQGWKHKNGYGVVTREGRDILAHRYAYMLEVGLIPDGAKVLHRCDNPPCVRPDHLFLGTQQDNIADMVSKNRQHRPAGTRNPKAKLNPELAGEIRLKFWNGKDSSLALAQEYGVGRSTIYRVIRGDVWAKGVSQ